MHLTEIEILLYVENKLPPEDRQELEAHVGRCDECARQFASLARLPDTLSENVPFEVNEAVLKEAVGLVGGKAWGRSWNFGFFNPPFRVAFAGVSVLAVALTTYLLVPRHEPSQFRSAETAAPMLRLFPSDGAKVADTHPAFRWSSTVKSSAYKFTLMDENGVSIWNWDVRDTAVSLPSTIVLIPGKTYLWRVESFLADKSLERSALHVFTYAPSQ
ncbi:MAG: hypothetical protein HW407_2185 [Bacteroidetes bacterium]|nr:hypothetical protein [Bacteroidota bacterium]